MKLTERRGEIAARIREEALGEILRLILSAVSSWRNSPPRGDEYLHRITADSINPGVTGFRVVQRVPDAPRSNLYRVTLETHADGSESLHWELIGPVQPLESDGNDEHVQP